MRHRHILSLLALLVWGTLLGTAHAQTMTLKEFKQLEKDITARGHNTRKISPQDGELAALIKIITIEKGFVFDGGSYGLVGTKEESGEIWLYVPQHSQHLKISHSRFGSCEFDYPVPIESGCTYQMLLDLGVGRYINIQASTPHAAIYLDGDSIGESPIYNRYVNYGVHTIKAVKDRMEGSTEIQLKREQDEAIDYSIPMTDQSVYYGNVAISTDPGAEIWMNGLLLGVGTWKGELREGNHVVETSKTNCDNSTTTINVVAQTENEFTVNPPSPHKGYIQLLTRPEDATVMHNRRTVIDHSDKFSLPVGTQTLTFSKKGYIDFEKEYNVVHNKTIHDTIRLEQIRYIKRHSFYFGASFVPGYFTGVAAHLGGTVANIDLQLSYMYGLTKSGTANFYEPGEDNIFIHSSQYSLNAIMAKLGYQIVLTSHFGLVPQAGLSLQSFSGKLLAGTKDTHSKASCTCISIGAKAIYAPWQHFSFYLGPEYHVAASKDEAFTDIADKAGFNAGGFYCNIGALVTF